MIDIGIVFHPVNIVACLLYAILVFLGGFSRLSIQMFIFLSMVVVLSFGLWGLFKNAL